jgi:hypothetical protein
MSSNGTLKKKKSIRILSNKKIKPEDKLFQFSKDPIDSLLNFEDHSLFILSANINIRIFFFSFFFF